MGGCSPSPSNSQGQADIPPNPTEAGSVSNQNPQDKKIILTTFTVLADIARNVAGDTVIVESLTKPGAEIHGYQPTPRDIVRAQKASLILDNGLGLERWAEKFYGDVKNVPHATLSEGVQPIDISEDLYKGKPNPHAWMSPQNALIYVENIRKALVGLDPAHAATYNANAAAYSQKIKDIDQTLQKELAVIPPDKRYMVSCEGAFSYLARDYKLKELYLWAVNSEQQATPKQVEQVIESVRQNKIPVVFCESTVSDEAQRQVASEAGAKFGGVFYVDSLSAANGPVPTYLKLMQYNVNTLVKGLQGR